MKINHLLRTVSELVSTRETIEHGSMRCLYSDADVIAIQSEEGPRSVGTSSVGDDDLSERIKDMDAGDVEIKDLVRLWDAFRGEDVQDYVSHDRENELKALDALIEAAEAL